MKKKPEIQWPAIFIASLVMLGLICLCVREYRVLPRGQLRISFFDVGQGDSAMIVTPSGKQILIDGGPDLRALEQMASEMSYFDRSIDMLMLSHPHADHLAAFPDILERYTVGGIALTGTVSEAARYQEMLDIVGKKKIPITEVTTGKEMDLGDGVHFSILWPPATLAKGHWSDLNDSSFVAKLTYKDHCALFMGDAEELVERALLKARVPVDCDILKVGHHGSDSSSTEAFIRAVSPTLAVISSGRGNRYGHPHAEILERYTHLNVPLWRTDTQGTLELVW